eukprot:CAMPEP_0178410772 /NCGR_PEP_ID=MMETSP0689_2-20121128/21156_1 /TAXON_ID=160604 /ORGANISM="Amphidinium massartii, Strain CS-259" /LENGTH=715 /DNA_ID=CAMNT_0020031967 /DNA_START=1 /DNA_END=2148 /DNA_ORIENTATION=+
MVGGARVGMAVTLQAACTQGVVAFLAPSQSMGVASPHASGLAVTASEAAATHHSAQPSAIHLRGPGGNRDEGSAETYGCVTIGAVMCGVVAGLSVQRANKRAQRACSTQMRGTMVKVEAPGGNRPAANGSGDDDDIDSVETAVKEFVPRIAALQKQAESLRGHELKKVIGSMQELRKSELTSVFKEVDGLLYALISAIQDMRGAAQNIRQSELRERFKQMDADAKQWVSSVEKDAVAMLTGYRSQEVDTMIEVHVVGLSHHSAPVEVREKLAVAEADWNRYSREMMEHSSTGNGLVVPEAAVLSTCNRFEVYFASPELKKFPALECVRSFLRQKSGLTAEELDPYLFSYTGEDAIQHLFQVSSGLDSLVLGEAQILAQVKACHERSIEKADPADEDSVEGSGGKMVSKLLNAGIRMGKIVRTRTKIGKGAVSVSSAAVELLLAKSMPDLKKYHYKTEVCILGAGKMGRLLMIALLSKDPDANVTLVNRSVDKAEAILDELKNRGGKNAKVAGTDKMWEVIDRSDVVFAATSSEDPIISAADLKDRKQRLMLVDICVPRNINPDCSDVEGVYSYSVDDLKKIQEANNAARQKEVLKARKFIDDEVRAFKIWQASQGAVPYLAALQGMAERIRREEWEKMSRNLSGLHEKERKAVDKLTRHIIDKMFRPIYYSMKDEEDIEAKKTKIWALKTMFSLEPVYKRRALPSGEAAKKQLNA